MTTNSSVTGNKDYDTPLYQSLSPMSRALYRKCSIYCRNYK